MYDPEKQQELQSEIERLEHSLTNQPPRNQLIVSDMERIRSDAKQLGITILTRVPKSRERSIAIHELEETVMWAIKAIAVNQ